MTVTLVGQRERQFIKVDISEETEERFHKARISRNVTVDGLLGRISQTVPNGEEMTEQHVVSFLEKFGH